MNAMNYACTDDPSVKTQDQKFQDIHHSTTDTPLYVYIHFSSNTTGKKWEKYYVNLNAYNMTLKTKYKGNNIAIVIL